MGVGSKREDQPSSSLGKRQKTSASHEFQDQGRTWMCFEAVREGSSLWFLSVEES